MPKLEVYRPDGQEWWELVNQNPSATFFHTPTWSRLICDAFPGFRDTTQVFRLEDGQRVLFPCVGLNTGLRSFFRGSYSTYPSTYGGFLSERPLSTEEARAIWRSLTSPRLSYTMISNPFDGHDVLSVLDLASTRDFTHVLDLSEGFDSVHQKRFERAFCNQERKARKSGVRVRLGAGPEDTAVFYDLYRKSVARWGEKLTMEYPYRYFEKLIAIGPPAVELRLAHLDGKVIAGAINCFHGRFVHPRSLVFDYEYHTLCPNTLLQSVCIESACAAGLCYYDLGASAGLEGVIKFKESMGAVRRDFVIYSKRSRLQQTYARLRHWCSHA